MHHDDPSQLNLQSKLTAPDDPSTPNTSSGTSSNGPNAPNVASDNPDTPTDTDGSPQSMIDIEKNMNTRKVTTRWTLTFAFSFAW